ncbi:MAG: hypothetical protein GC160_07425 [Acidobacteria bacterium]|nr:hypothetical protein [Acidobacteriota bacterium]
MKNSSLHYFVREPEAVKGFRTGVSLHSHTMHSKESTAFIARIAKKSKFFNWFIRNQMRKYSETTDLKEQVGRMWWTSPWSPGQALRIEKGQIEGLGLKPLVSISDHDNIEAPLQLQMIADNRDAPISVEWTTPYEKTYFHIGVHNLHPRWAVEMMRRMAELTANPDKKTLRDMFHELSSNPDVLIIFNHPYWDQPWLGAEYHDKVMRQFIAEYRPYLHALEINGLRSWTENRKVVKLSKQLNMPLISGGDRHGREPNATLNLTKASTFAEFVEEFRDGAPSKVLVMPQFHDPLVLRVIQSMADILADHPEHANGKVRWSERVYRHCIDDSIKPFTAFFENGEPFIMRRVINGAHILTSPRLRPAWMRMAESPEAAL